MTVLYGEKKKNTSQLSVLPHNWNGMSTVPWQWVSRIALIFFQRSIVLLLVLPLTQYVNLDQSFHLWTVYSSVNWLS